MRAGGGQGLAVVVMAAGQGTRMRSRLPKVLHEAAGETLVGHVLAAVAPLGPERVVVIVRHGAERVRAALAGAPLVCVDQGPRDGTGAAVAAARSELEGTFDTLLVLNGDAPLLRPESLARLLEVQRAGGAGMSILTYEVDDPSGLGRVRRDATGAVEAIVEERDATADERRIREVNPGTYAFDARVWSLLGRVGDDNAAGEYYLTDVVAEYRAAALGVRAVLGDDETRLLVGVNDRAQLARAEALLRERTRARWLAEGVTMHAPDTTSIDAGVRLARDVVLEDGVLLRGACEVGEGARIGAYAVLRDCTVAPGAQVAPHTVATGKRVE
ncbi:MAG: bifunctional N-acetylglucosamine-1-phosphate uridyltransferase/glucosamine-1-phosphate acetyltransferase [Trueperaceae bacterium]|nr:MAG: bifunctional N-acetylglucosamine-1-phosphate uridyltransferase/glucosamine-1-phosphate acetyltransferase [Trueperaceae bacterium]